MSTDAPGVIHSAVCLLCGEESLPVEDEAFPVEVWALAHTGRYPDHRHFKVMTETFWRVGRGDAAVAGASGECRGVGEVEV
ncbi:DUF7848 domain-containing protein [Streptomyces capparidis]